MIEKHPPKPTKTTRSAHVGSVVAPVVIAALTLIGCGSNSTSGQTESRNGHLTQADSSQSGPLVTQWCHSIDDAAVKALEPEAKLADNADPTSYVYPERLSLGVFCDWAIPGKKNGDIEVSLALRETPDAESDVKLDQREIGGRTFSFTPPDDYQPAQDYLTDLRGFPVKFQYLVSSLDTTAKGLTSWNTSDAVARLASAVDTSLKKFLPLLCKADQAGAFKVPNKYTDLADYVEICQADD